AVRHRRARGLRAQHVDRWRIPLPGAMAYRDRSDAKRALFDVPGDRWASSIIARRNVPPSLLQWRHRDPRRQLRAAPPRVPRMRPGHERCDQLDLGEGSGPDGPQGLGLLTALSRWGSFLNLTVVVVFVCER